MVEVPMNWVMSERLSLWTKPSRPLPPRLTTPSGSAQVKRPAKMPPGPTTSWPGRAFIENLALAEAQSPSMA